MNKEQILFDSIEKVLKGISRESFNEILIETSEEGDILRASLATMETYAQRKS